MPAQSDTVIKSVSSIKQREDRKGGAEVEPRKFGKARGRGQKGEDGLVGVRRERHLQRARVPR